MRIKDIPGVGEKTAGRLIDYYGSEEEAIQSILDGDVAGVAQSGGVSPRQAASIVKAAIGIEEDMRVEDFLRTEEARRIYESLMSMLAGCARTDYARANTRVFFPCGSQDRIERVQEQVREWRSLARRVDVERAGRLLEDVRPLGEPRARQIRDRVFIASDAEIASNARGLGVEVCTVGGPEEYVDVARGYGWAYIDDADPLVEVDLPGEVKVETVNTRKTSVWWTAPERVLQFYAHNQDSILAALQLQEMLDPDSKTRELIKFVRRINEDGQLAGGVDPVVDRLNHALSSLDEVVRGETERATEKLRESIRESEVSIGGAEVLDRLEQGATDIRPLLESRIRQSYQEITREAEENIRERLGLPNVESIYPEEVVFPIEPMSLDRLRLRLRGEKAGREMSKLREAARELERARDTVQSAVKKAFELDLHLAVAEFTREMTMPRLQEEGVDFEDAVNLQLAREHGLDYVTPVSYDFNRGAVVLSGVNSGGKTSTLDLVAQVVILAHMGFPVPAENAGVGVVDGLYYFAKSRGTLDAGAFETTLRQFSSLASSGNELVLADELEAITEPGASARIIAGILESIYDAGGCAVFVSHLAEAIQEHAACPLRVDGIEATGLDENLNLIVDRNPRKDYVAKSTPQLILERLARGSEGENKSFYRRMLEKFR